VLIFWSLDRLSREGVLKTCAAIATSHTLTHLQQAARVKDANGDSGRFNQVMKNTCVTDQENIASHTGDIVSEPLKLEWRGPLTFGNLPESKEAVADLRRCVVYIFFRCYDGFRGKTLVYVGKSENFVERLATHYSDFLSSKYGALYEEDGSPFREGGLPLYFQSLERNLDETLRHSIADARRTRFVYARADKERLRSVEATIISRLESSFSKSESFQLENTPCSENLIDDSPIQHSHSELKVELLTDTELDRLLMILSACQNA
jgi:hypothetical protein